MNKLKTLKEFENFYDAIQPAQEKSQEAFVWFSGIPHPLFNAVMHLSCQDVNTKVDALIEKKPPNSPITFWIHSENKAEGLARILKERAFESIITCPLMSWSVKPISIAEFDIRPAVTEVFHEIISKVYQFDEEVKNGFQNLMKNAECENYLLYLDGKPIGTGTLVMNGSVGGIFNEASLPERREANIIMMQFLMHRSYELNLKQLIVLSSPEAEELYTNLGFENLFNIEIYSR